MCRAPALAAVSAAVTPVAFNSISPGSPTWVAAGTNDISVVIPSTTRGLLLVPIAYTDGSAHTITGIALDPSGANTALTQVSGAAKSTASANLNSGFGGVDCFYLKLVGITPGTYTVRVTADSGTPVMVATGLMFDFVSQTSPIGTVANATGVSAAPSSGAISSNVSNMLVGACCAFMTSSGADVTTPDTQDLSTRETFGFTSAGLNASHTQGSGSHAMTWANTEASFGWACCGIELVAG